MNNSVSKLCELRDCEQGRIIAMDGCGNLKRRLNDMGFFEGTCVKRLFSAPAGDPSAYWIRDTVVALRASDVTGIVVIKNE